MYKFEEGAHMRVLFDIVSDGTVCCTPRGDLVMKLGSTGYIKKRGTFLDDIVYELDFLEEGKTVGCREHELLPAELPWSPPVFQKKDQIKAVADIKRRGEVVVPAGLRGRVLVLDYHDDLGYIYEVEFENEYRNMVAKEEIELD